MFFYMRATMYTLNKVVKYRKKYAIFFIRGPKTHNLTADTNLNVGATLLSTDLNKRFCRCESLPIDAGTVLISLLSRARTRSSDKAAISSGTFTPWGRAVGDRQVDIGRPMEPKEGRRQNRISNQHPMRGTRDAMRNKDSNGGRQSSTNRGRTSQFC